MKAIMLDMEFLDTTPSAAILSIGAVEMDFNTLTTGRTFYIEVSSEDCVRHGMTISPSTVRFWAEENHGELVRLISEGRSSLRNALDELFTFYRDVQRDMCAETGEEYPEAWSCGSLDMEIIKHAVQLLAEQNLQRDIPWKFWVERDFRTLRNEICIDHPYEGRRHHALDDALNQANHLLAIKRYLRDSTKVLDTQANDLTAQPSPVKTDEVNLFNQMAFDTVVNDLSDIAHDVKIGRLGYISGGMCINMNESESLVEIRSNLILKEV